MQSDVPTTDTAPADPSTRRPVVTLFPAAAAPTPAASPVTTGATCDPAGDCCGPGATAADPNEALSALAEQVTRHFGERADVEIAGYWSQADVETTVEKLNAALRQSGKRFEVTSVNFYTFVESVAPLVAVDGQILCTRRAPSWDELQAAVDVALAKAEADASG